MWCIVVSEQIACRFTWNCFLSWILNVSLHSTSWAGDKKESVVDNPVQWSLVSGAASALVTSLFFFFKKSLFYASIDTIAIVCLRTGPDKAPRPSNDTCGSCHLILYISSTNYFQIVRWQCCLYWSTTGNFLELPVVCLLFLTSTCPNMALYRIAIKTRLLTLLQSLPFFVAFSDCHNISHL